MRFRLHSLTVFGHRFGFLNIGRAVKISRVISRARSFKPIEQFRLCNKWNTYYWITYIFFCFVLLTVHPSTIFFKWSRLGTHCFLVYLFQLLYMFRATMCPSSAKFISVSMRQWYFLLCMGGCLFCRPDSHPYRAKNTSVA
jgi:hypothetical protein